MPDWIAHLMFGSSLSPALGLHGTKRVIFLVGNLMPDFVRFLVILAGFIKQDEFLKFIAYPINNASHSILGVLFFSIFFSIFFDNHAPQIHDKNATSIPNQPKGKTRNLSWKRFIEEPWFLLFTGGMGHLFLDTFMWPWAGGIMYLWPIDIATFRWSFKLIWPANTDAILFLLPIFITTSMIEVILHYKRKKNVHVVTN
ncbi:MAG: metal-dependent hydrolase [Promethearchaeota archaeon]